MKAFFLIILVLPIILFAQKSANNNVGTLFYNGDIVTMEGANPQYVQALVIKEGKIAFAGNLKEAERQFKNVAKYNLNGHTLLPGFVDGHGHMYNTGLVSLLTNLLPPPDGPCSDIQKVVEAVNQWKVSDDGKFIIAEFGWIMGHGYDDSQLKEKAHPTAKDLDKISEDIPVLIIHQSEHLGVLNSKGLKMAGYTKDSPDPAGGHIVRYADGTPTGVIEENALFNLLFPIIGKGDQKLIDRVIKSAQKIYAENGYMTVQDGRTTPGQVKIFENAAKNNQLYLDINAYPDITLGTEDMNSIYTQKGDHYINHFKIAGVKLVLDGSPQGKTAWITDPYLIPPAGDTAGYHGFPVMNDEKAFGYVETAFKNHWQIICHTNGDEAIDQYLNAIDNAEKNYNYPDHRSIINHGQTIRKDQLQRAAKLKACISLFAAHTFYWGDWYVASVLGHPRADYISPCRDAVNAGLNLTSHHDAPVIFPHSMRVLDATVNRVTRSGYVLGPDQRLTPYEGLLTLTRWAAYQYFEENSKGTLTSGKRADLVILEKNPLKIEPLKIHDIKILVSIKDGKEVYKQ